MSDVLLSNVLMSRLQDQDVQDFLCQHPAWFKSGPDRVTADAALLSPRSDEDVVRWSVAWSGFRRRGEIARPRAARASAAAPRFEAPRLASAPDVPELGLGRLGSLPEHTTQLTVAKPVRRGLLTLHERDEPLEMLALETMPWTQLLELGVQPGGHTPAHLRRRGPAADAPARCDGDTPAHMRPPTRAAARRPSRTDAGGWQVTSRWASGCPGPATPPDTRCARGGRRRLELAGVPGPAGRCSVPASLAWPPASSCARACAGAGRAGAGSPRASAFFQNFQVSFNRLGD